MISGYDIVCFGNDWDGDPLSKHHVMTHLARGNRVLWVNSIGNRNPRPSTRDLKRVWKKLCEFFKGPRRVDQNVYVVTPILIPFHGSRIARWINCRWLRWSLRRPCRQLGFRNLVTWSFVPSSAGVAGHLGEQFLVYHCVDEFSEFTGTRKRALLEIERRLMQEADVVMVSSARLYESKRRHNPNTYLVTHGVDVDHFGKACLPELTVPEDIRSLRRPVIGFYGLIADWVDLELVAFLARSRPHWSFVMIGKEDTDPTPVRALPNVHLIGRRAYEMLPEYSKGFDAAILPFVINELTLASNPLKVREYLAAGLPVVATRIPEAEKFSKLLSIAETREDFLAKIDRILESGRTGPQLSVSQEMHSESWKAKVEEMCQILEHVRNVKTEVRDCDVAVKTEGGAGCHGLEKHPFTHWQQTSPARLTKEGEHQ